MTTVRHQGNLIQIGCRLPRSASSAETPPDTASLSAEGIRGAFYFGIACGRELCRSVLAGDATVDQALRHSGVQRPPPQRVWITYLLQRVIPSFRRARSRS